MPEQRSLHGTLHELRWNRSSGYLLGFAEARAPLEYIRQNCIKKFSTGTDILFCLFPRFLSTVALPSSTSLPSSLRREDSNGLSLAHGRLATEKNYLFIATSWLLPPTIPISKRGRGVARQLNFNAMMRNLLDIRCTRLDFRLSVTYLSFHESKRWTIVLLEYRRRARSLKCMLPFYIFT